VRTGCRVAGREKDALRERPECRPELELRFRSQSPDVIDALDKACVRAPLEQLPQHPPAQLPAAHLERVEVRDRTRRDIPYTRRRDSWIRGVVMGRGADPFITSEVPK